MDNIHICGVSGKFPDCSNVFQFWEKLCSGVDMVTEDDRRWKAGYLGLPKRKGTIADVDKFDASFFDIHGKQASNIDPQLRMLLEVSFEAIIDAGQNLQTLRGSRTGVWVGASTNDASEALTSNCKPENGYGLTGSNRAMFANRISFQFDFKGPSATVDSACSSSMLALQMAYQSLLDGNCEAALVAGCNLTLKPQISVQFQKLKMLSPDGACKSFDANANGYARSESIAAVFICKEFMVKHSYCRILNAQTNSDGYTPKGITFPSGSQQKKLYEESYKSCGQNPGEVFYIEAHGTGTQAGDVQELNVIDEIFCSQGRKNPLFIGSVKSNMGHSEAPSGLCSLIKCVLALKHQTIPGNLHFNSPNSNVSGLMEKRLIVVTQATPVPKSSVIGINSFGFGGTNVHVILKRDENESSLRLQPSTVTNMHLLTSRTVEGIQDKVDHFKNVPEPVDNLNMKVAPKLHPYRGFVACANNQVVDGMGCQWVGMGRDLLQLPIFSQSIDRCNQALVPYHVNVRSLLENAITYDDVINSFVAIVAIQIGLVDILSAVGVKPDGIIGHSVGELGCSYADGCLTLEQTIKVAYLRGKCIKEANLPLGAMAAVGMTWQEALDQCPQGVAPACDNAEKSVTISGAKKQVEEYVETLKIQGIFAKLVSTGGIVFHSKDMEVVYPKFLNLLKPVIPNSLRRSSRWISTSQSETGNTECSPEYHAHNLRSPVRFNGALKRIPGNAVVVEVAPHGILQAILKRSLTTQSQVILAHKDQPNGLLTLCKAFGDLHCHGFDLDLQSIIPRTNLDRVSLHGLFDWNHSQSWPTPALKDFLHSPLGDAITEKFVLKIDQHSEEYKYLWDHVIDGRTLLPGAAHLVFAWKAFASYLGQSIDETPIQFDNVTVHTAIVLPEKGSVDVIVHLITSANEFRVTENNILVCSGKIQTFRGSIESVAATDSNTKKEMPLTHEEFYKKLRLLGYHHNTEFKQIQSLSLRATAGEVTFTGNYVVLLDALIQFTIILRSSKQMDLPTRFRRVKIVPIQKTGSALRIFHDRYLDRTTVGNVVEFDGLHTTPAMRHNKMQTTHLKQVFLPHNQLNVSEMDEKTSLYKNQVAKCISDYQDLFSTNIISVDKSLDAVFASKLSNTDSRLLKLLKEFCRKNQNSKNESQLLEYKGSVFDPLLTYCLSNSDVLWPVLDCAVENASGDIRIAVIQPKSTPNNHDLLHLIDSWANTCAEISMEIREFEGNTKGSYLKTNLQRFSPTLIVLHNPLSEVSASLLKVITSHLKNSDGMLLFHQNTKETSFHRLATAICKDFSSFTAIPYELIERQLAKENFSMLIRKSDHRLGSELILCRQIKKTMTHEYQIEVGNDFRWIKPLQGKLKSNENNVIVLTACNEVSGIVGLAKSLRKETNKQIRVVLGNSAANKCNENLITNVWKHGEWGAFHRVVYQAHNMESKSLHLEMDGCRALVEVTHPGDLSSLKWVNSPLKQTDLPLYKVEFAALNFRDVMLASGKLPRDAVPGDRNQYSSLLGLEFSGHDHVGCRVMGLVAAEGLATHVATDPIFTYKVPDDWGMEEAASIPVVYSTAYYALLVRGQLKRGESVLVHSGAGGVGQAAIAIALSQECRVFTTVSSEHKRAFLMRRFPQLGPHCFANSRDVKFKDHVMHCTNGKGVDVVLNSLSGEKLQASIRCLGENGRFLEIGKHDLAKNSLLEMSHFLRNITFHGILLDSLFTSKTGVWEEVRSHVTDGMRSGVVNPLQTKSFARNDVESAFRYMSKGQHIGKIVVHVADNVATKFTSRTICDPKLTYVVTGGLGDLGLEFCDCGYQESYINNWQKNGIRVDVTSTDVTNIGSVRELLDESVGGIFHLAATLRDGLFVNQSEKTFEAVCNPKCQGIDCLDSVSREVCKKLRWFVVFSSVVSAQGNLGQTNYGLANSYMERVCEARRRDGLPGLAIQWGPIAEVGMAANVPGSILGFKPCPVQLFLKDLDVFLTNSDDTAAVVSSLIFAPRIKHGEVEQKESVSVLIAKILGLSRTSEITETSPMSNFGVDSLMCIEMSQKIVQEYGVTISVDDLPQMSLQDIKRKITGKNVHTGVTEASDIDVDWKATESKIISRVLDLLQPRPSSSFFVALKESDASQAPWFFFSALGRSNYLYEDITTHMMAPAYGFHVTDDDRSGSIVKMATRFSEEIGERRVVNLVGFSFGAVVALETALQMQNDAEQINLVLIDSSHTFVNQRIEAFYNLVGLGQFFDVEHAIMTNYVRELLLEGDLQKISDVLSESSNTLDRIDRMVQIVREISPDCSRINLAKSLLRFTKGLKLATEYVPTSRLTSDVTLVMQSRAKSKDYDLGKICDGQVKIVKLEAHHKNIVFGKNGRRVADVINEITLNCI